MASSVSALSSAELFSPITIPASQLTSSAASSSPDTSSTTGGITAQQQMQALESSGQLKSVLSDSIAAAVVQYTTAQADNSTSATQNFSGLVSQMLQAYSTTGSVSSTDPSSGTSVLQALQSQGDLGQVSSDSIAASVLQTVTA